MTRLCAKHSTIPILVAVCLCLSVTGCPEIVSDAGKWKKYPPLAKDQNGDMPDDVLRKFIEAVKSNDYVGARSCWFGEQKELLKRMEHPEALFTNYCQRFVALTNYSVSKPVRGKPGWYMIDVSGFTNGVLYKEYNFGVKDVGGRWCIGRGYIW